ncbi:trypsin-like serine peptidase [Streptomyces sp. NPDC051561]|uniref:trypsin-like serine peptidase n=1 Tax=Streptomyces sp. NPDC051561 TaxID=3365658 RepID=UPI0037B1B46D
MITALTLAGATLAATATLLTPTSPSPSPVDGTEATRAYWTPERMREAASTSPLDGLRAPAAPRPPDGVPWIRSTAPVAHIGRLFMVLPGGQKATCTAAVVYAKNRDVISTAGHCVHLKAVGGAMKSLLFVPGYANGQKPYGSYPARSVGVADAWKNSEDHKADFAFVTLARDEKGRHVQDVVGARRAIFGHGPAGPRTALGYPYVKPYDGESLQYCESRATPVKDDRLLGGSQLRPCRMTNGASGGPWYARTANGEDIQVAVTSSRPRGEAEVAWGAVLDATAKGLYNTQSRL